MELMSNIHQPQEVLIKVMCSERLPESDEPLHVEDGYANYSKTLDVWRDCSYDEFDLRPDYWYEPVTRIVLTEEEYKELESERLAYKDFIEWWFKNKYDATENVGNFIETIRFIQDRLGY